MSEDLIIRHCSPTLAGIKTGNIFSCRVKNKQDLNESIRKINRRLIKRGLRIIPLRYNNGKALVYVYRPSRLTEDLNHATAQELLKERGYAVDTPEKCIIQLIKRLAQEEDFPHEIGLFLGYPPEDVNGFINNSTDGYKCVGTWKVYGDEEKAKKTFEKYKKCIKVYNDCWTRGSSIEKLTVNLA